MNFERWETIKIQDIPSWVLCEVRIEREKRELKSQMYYLIWTSVHTWVHSNICSSIWSKAAISLQNSVAVLISEDCFKCDFNGVEKRQIVIFPCIHQEKRQKNGNVSATQLCMLLSPKYLGLYRWNAEKARSTKQMFLKTCGV